MTRKRLCQEAHRRTEGQVRGHAHLRRSRGKSTSTNMRIVSWRRCAGVCSKTVRARTARARSRSLISKAIGQAGRMTPLTFTRRATSCNRPWTSLLSATSVSRICGHAQTKIQLRRSSPQDTRARILLNRSMAARRLSPNPKILSFHMSSRQLHKTTGRGSSLIWLQHQIWQLSAVALPHRHCQLRNRQQPNSGQIWKRKAQHCSRNIDRPRSSKWNRLPNASAKSDRDPKARRKDHQNQKASRSSARSNASTHS